MKDIYNILIENLTNERLDSIAFQDKDYCTITEELDEILRQFDQLSLPEKENKLVNRILSTYNSQFSRYINSHIGKQYKMQCSC